MSKKVNYILAQIISHVTRNEVEKDFLCSGCIYLLLQGPYRLKPTYRLEKKRKEYISIQKYEWVMYTCTAITS